MTVGDLGDLRHVVDLQQRIGQHLEIHGLGRTSMRRARRGATGDGVLERVVVGGVHFLNQHAPTLEVLMEQRVRAAVDVLADDDAVARAEYRQHGVDCRQPGTECEAARAVLELGDLPFQELAGRVAAARVIPTGHGIDRFESISGRVVDRRIHGSGVVVVHRQAMDELSVEPGHDVHPLGFDVSLCALCAVIINYLTRSCLTARAVPYRYWL